MRTIILLILLRIVAFPCFAQEKNADSIAADNFKWEETKLVYDQLFIFSDNSLYGTPDYLGAAFFNQPLFPENNWKIDFDALKRDRPVAGFSMLYGYVPSFGVFSIMNQARYQVNGRFSVGGNSFSGSSLFDPMPLNRPFNERGVKGVSMFMEYKVSNKFTFGVRVEMINHQPLFPIP